MTEEIRIGTYNPRGVVVKRKVSYESIINAVSNRIFKEREKLLYEKWKLEIPLATNHSWQVRKIFNSLQLDIGAFVIWHDMLKNPDLDSPFALTKLLQKMRIQYDWEGLLAIFQAISSQFEAIEQNADAWLISNQTRISLDLQIKDLIYNIVDKFYDLSTVDYDESSYYESLKLDFNNQWESFNYYEGFVNREQLQKFIQICEKIHADLLSFPKPSFGEKLVLMREDLQNLIEMLRKLNAIYDPLQSKQYFEKMQQSLESLHRELEIVSREYYPNMEILNEMEDQIVNLISPLEEKELDIMEQEYFVAGKMAVQSIRALREKTQEFFHKDKIENLLRNLFSSIDYLLGLDDSVEMEDPEHNEICTTLREIKMGLAALETIYDCRDAIRIKSQKIKNIQ